MKYLFIFIIAMSFSGCTNAQKSVFHALNKSTRSIVVIYNTTSVSSTCIAPSGGTTNIYISGFPVIGSTCYTTQFGGVKFVGDGNWYYSSTWATSYQINSSGIIIALVAC